MKMFAIPVSDTISEILQRFSSLTAFGLNLTQNTKHHLNAIKDKCPEKLDLSDTKTREWVEQVTDLFYLVDDLFADIALFRKQSNRMLACKFYLTSLLQLKRIEKKVVRVKESIKDLKKLSYMDDKDYQYYYKEIIKERSLAKEEGIVRAVVTFTVTDKEKKKAGNAAQHEEVKSEFDVVKLIDVNSAEFVISEVEEEKKKKKKKKEEIGEEKEKEKGILVVLDYYQNDQDSKEWLKLAEKLKKMAVSSGGGGVVLLVITNKLSVARLVQSSFETTLFRFDWLSPSRTTTMTWSLFEKIAQAIDSLLNVPGGLVSEATETVEKLVMSQKPSSESDIIKLKDNFLQDMWLKYYEKLRLPNWRLRQCFAYSLFVFSLYRYEYVKSEMLIRLWTAQGFLGHSSKEPEDLGGECIIELSNRSILYDYRGHIYLFAYIRDWIKVMVGDNGGVWWDEDNKGSINNDHVSLCSKLDALKGIPRSSLKTNKNVRTFHLEEKKSRPPDQVMLSWFACDSIFSAFKRLRVLILKSLGIKVLPDSIEDLTSLRYLDLSCNNLKKLNLCIGELRYLQTLILSYCLKLEELPNDVNHFVSLTHLEVDHCPRLMHMPSALKRLTWLRSLPHFVASSSNGVEELTNLNDIRGDLTISHLERLTTSSPSGRAYLKEKQHLHGLTLKWNHHSEDKQNQIIMLTHLEPHPNLKVLSVIGYPGKQFAPWLKNLVEISLYYCPEFRSLPTLDVANLEKLTLFSLHSLEFITDKYCESPKLERVKISNCPNLTSWWKSGAHNTLSKHLSELVIEHCPNLVSMPLFPNLFKLVLDSSNMEPLLNTLRHNSSTTPLSTLHHLEMVNLDEKQYPVEDELFKNFTSLGILEIRNCRDLKSMKGWKHLSSLDKLHISNCLDINMATEEWEGMETVTDLVIENIPNLEHLPGVQHLDYLENLEIRNCPQLKALPDVDNIDIFSTVFIQDCPKLDSWPDNFREVRSLTVRNCPLLEAWKLEQQKKKKGHFNF